MTTCFASRHLPDRRRDGHTDRLEDLPAGPEALTPGIVSILRGSLADIGLPAVSRDDLQRVAERACIPGESIHHEPVHLSPALVVDALLSADDEGRRRKGPLAGR